MRNVARALACFLFASPVWAEPADYGRVITFGDSLSDNGNLKAFGLAPPPPYYYGRFSNGLTGAELLAGAGGGNGESGPQQFWVNVTTLTPLNGGSVNTALGGARADNGPNALGPIPGVPTQIGVYELYSTVSGQTPFKPSDLVTLWAGANDIFQGYATAAPGGLAGLQTLGATAATSVAADLNQLIAGGAKTVLVGNLPNIGLTPNYLQAGQQAGGQAVTLAFNQALNVKVEAVAGANPGVNVVQADVYSLNNYIRARAAAFGLTDLTDPCVTTPSCNKVTAAGFAFWDGVHPTEQGHELFARFASLLLSTEETGKAISALGQVALSTRLDASDILFRRGVSPFGSTPPGLYAEVIGSTASFDGSKFATYGSTAYDYSLGGVRVGFDSAYGPIAFGSAFAYQQGSLSGDALSGTLKTAQIDSYALSRLGPFFAGAEGGVSLNNYSNLSRETGFPTLSAGATTSSVDYTVAGTVGATYQFGPLALTPAFRVGYASLNLNGFTESAPVLALQYSNQDVTTGFWTARVRASTPLPWGAALIYGEAGYEGLFSTSDAYSAKLAFNTAQAVSLNENLNARGFFIKAGVGGHVFANVIVSGEYELSTQDGNGDIHSGRLRVTVPLD